MSRQIDQEIIQATNELQEDVRLTHDIVTGDENTVVEVSPGNQVRSPKKMIEDAYAETKEESSALLNQLQIQGGRKNLLINGDFSINQRAKLEYEDSDYCLDRWRMWSGGKVQQVANTSPAQTECAIRMTKTESAAVFYALIQRIEGIINQVAGKQLTLSFYIRSNRVGNLIAILQNHEDSRSITSGTYTINKANTWERKEITFAPYSKQEVADHTLTIYLASSINSLLTNNGDWLEFAAAQLEIGETATEFEITHPGTEMALCQRYYCKSYGYDTVPGSANTYYGNIIHHNSMQMGASGYYIFGSYFPVRMRTAPTISIYSPSTGQQGRVDSFSDPKAISVNSANENGFCLRAEENFAADTFISLQYQASAEI